MLRLYVGVLASADAMYKKILADMFSFSPPPPPGDWGTFCWALCGLRRVRMGLGLRFVSNKSHMVSYNIYVEWIVALCVSYFFLHN